MSFDEPAWLVLLPLALLPLFAHVRGALPAAPDAAQRRAAFERLHAALNASAGEVLFEPGVDRFIAQRPGFAPLRDELLRFFAQSRAEFFAGAPTGVVDMHWLRTFCRRCRDAERGAA